MKSAMPTMKDVALEAGVALGTVSKVFNGIPVGESYKARVEEAARKLGYQVNQYARGLKTNKTNTVAVILPGVNHPFFAALAQHACEALAQRDYRMLLYVTASNPGVEQIGGDPPFVGIDRSFRADIPCVAADNYGGGRLAAEKLLELGCRHLAFLRTGSSSPSETDKRGDGFEAVCRARQVPYEILRRNDGEDSPEVFREFFLSHMTGGTLDIDGIFCSTDLLAWRTQNLLAELGIRVPEDVQLIGFDGIRRFGGEGLYCSTIVQPAQKIAETCVDLLLAKDRSNIPALVCLPVSYAPGGTTRE